MNTIRNIRPAIARTRTTSIIVKAGLVLGEGFGLSWLLLLVLLFDCDLYLCIFMIIV